MSITRKRTRTAASLAVAALALAGSVAVAVPAGAATTTAQPKAVAPHVVSPHAATCDSFGSNSYSWWANCRVTSGTSRAAAACTDGTVHYGSWVGVGYWKFGMNCYPYAMSSYWIENGG
jgi:hypothetical protein